MATGAIFLDAGAVIARYRDDDDNHGSAVAGWSRMIAGEVRCFTTPFVVAEAATMLARIRHYEFGATRARLLLTSPLIQVVRTTVEEEVAAADVMEKYADQRIGFVDCVSFVVMKRHRLRHVFGFDKHFTYAGFRLWPGK